MKKQYLILGIVAVLVVVIVVILMMQDNQSIRSPYTTSPSLSDEEMELTDVGAELETLDTDFDADLQKLDEELKGL
jgi:peptidoglycan hydrolase CwlO-like protein